MVRVVRAVRRSLTLQSLGLGDCRTYGVEGETVASR
jgi:hypothetical protein